jgi:hypothetical protein
VSARRRAATAAGQVILWLLPPDRRDWVEALWAESRTLPSGQECLSWRAGAAALIAREAIRGWRSPGRITFLAAAALAAFACWPGSSASTATVADRADVVAAVVMLAVVGWLARRLFGAVRTGWLPRVVRAAGYGAILALLPAQAVAVRYCYGVVGSHPFLRRYDAASLHGGVGLGVIMAFFLLILSGSVLAVLWATSARGRVTSGALTLAVGLGLVLGACGYLSAPLGPRATTGIDAVNPWLPRSWLGWVTIADWVLLFAGPALLGPVAGLCFAGQGDRGSLPGRRFIQCLCVGVLANVVAALTATVMASATIAAALTFPSAANWLDRGADLKGTAAYLWGLNAVGSESAYLIVCLCVPFVGLVVGVAVGALAFGREVLAGGQSPSAGGGGGRGDGGPPRDPAPRAPAAPQGGRAPEVPDRHPVLTG